MTISNYINLKTDHDFPFKQFGKKWVCYYPDYEGIYAISDTLDVLRLETKQIKTNGVPLTTKARIKKPRIFKDGGTHKTIGYYSYVLSKTGYKNKDLSKLEIYKFLIKKKLIEEIKITFPFIYENELVIGWLKGYEGSYVITDAVNVLLILNLDNNLKITLNRLSISNNDNNTLRFALPKTDTSKRMSINRDRVLEQVTTILSTMSDE